MDADQVRGELVRRGGVADRSDLPFPKRVLARAVTEGLICRLSPGRYALPVVAGAAGIELGIGH